MKTTLCRVADLAVLERRAVSVDPETIYTEIGLRSYGRGVFLKPPVTGAEIGAKRVFHVEPGDLLISNIFAWEGAVALADDSQRGSVGSHRFMTWRVSDEAAEGRYLKHYFTSDAGIAQLRQASPGSAGRNRTLSIAALERIEVPLPPLPEQRRVAEHLDSVERTTRTTRAAAVEMRWRATIEQLAGSVPGVARIALRDVLAPRSGSVVDPAKSYRIAGIYSFGRGLLDRSSIRGHETKYKTLTHLNSGNVVYSKLGAFEGAVAVVDERFGGAYVSPEFPVFAVEDFDPRFLRYCFIASSFVNQLSAATSGVGARQKRVSPGSFVDLTIPAMPLREQRRRADFLDRFTQALELSRHADAVTAALLPAARNEIFNSLR